jgi:hypothetical protein
MLMLMVIVGSMIDVPMTAVLISVMLLIALLRNVVWLMVGTIVVGEVRVLLVDALLNLALYTFATHWAHLSAVDRTSIAM